MENIKSAGWEPEATQLSELRLHLRESQPAAPQRGMDMSIRHETAPPTHQWILLQAGQIWSTPELAARMPAAWSDDITELDRYPLTHGVRMEDAELDISHYALCGGHPYCDHFWDPAKGDDAGLYFLRQWDSGYCRAQRLWDEQVLPRYRAGEKDQAYYWLGRVAHLLSDLSVPAHTHRDIHISWESFEKYLVAGGPEAYNFKLWKASGAPREAATLRELFLSMADLANEFDSAHVAGSLPENHIGHNGAWEEQGGTYRYYTVSLAECRRQAQVLMPAAFRHMAGLYKLFWKQTHPPAAEQGSAR